MYGSLRSGFQHAALDYISKHFTLVSNARVKGLLYDLGSYPAAVATADDSFITGELYELKNEGEFDWAIEQLDDYEGLNPEPNETALYRRELTDVFYDNQSAKAWIYWYNQDVKGQPVIPSGDIFDYPTYKSKL